MKKKYILWGRWEVYEDNRKYIEYVIFAMGIVGFAILFLTR
jgi:hypothetical protein